MMKPFSMAGAEAGRQESTPAGLPMSLHRPQCSLLGLVLRTRGHTTLTSAHSTCTMHHPSINQGGALRDSRRVGGGPSYVHPIRQDRNKQAAS